MKGADPEVRPRNRKLISIRANEDDGRVLCGPGTWYKVSFGRPCPADPSSVSAARDVSTRESDAAVKASGSSDSLGPSSRALLVARSLRHFHTPLRRNRRCSTVTRLRNKSGRGHPSRPQVDVSSFPFAVLRLNLSRGLRLFFRWPIIIQSSHNMGPLFTDDPLEIRL